MSKKAAKNNIINVKELRKNMPELIKRVGKGESFTVFKRSKPAFKLSPVGWDDVDDESNWETIDFTEINENGISGREILEIIKKIDG